MNIILKVISIFLVIFKLYYCQFCTDVGFVSYIDPNTVCKETEFNSDPDTRIYIGKASQSAKTLNARLEGSSSICSGIKIESENMNWEHYFYIDYANSTPFPSYQTSVSCSLKIKDGTTCIQNLTLYNTPVLPEYISLSNPNQRKIAYSQKNRIYFKFDKMSAYQDYFSLYLRDYTEYPELCKGSLVDANFSAFLFPSNSSFPVSEISDCPVHDNRVDLTYKNSKIKKTDMNGKAYFTYQVCGKVKKINDYLIATDYVLNSGLLLRNQMLYLFLVLMFLF